MMLGSAVFHSIFAARMKAFVSERNFTPERRNGEEELGFLACVLKFGVKAICILVVLI